MICDSIGLDKYKLTPSSCRKLRSEKVNRKAAILLKILQRWVPASQLALEVSNLLLELRFGHVKIFQVQPRKEIHHNSPRRGKNLSYISGSLFSRSVHQPH